MEARWRIELLGGLRAEIADRVVTHFRSQNVGTLLAYLALHSRDPQPREALIELLWPEIDPEVGRTNFRSALHSLRQELEATDAAPAALLIADRRTVRLDPAAFSSDVAELRAGLERAARATDPAERARLLRGAVALYRGELLPGRFDPWVLTEREALAESYRGALQQLAAALERTGDLDGALEAARRAVAADPLREEAHYELMRLYAAAGQPSATVRQYHELERLLREELGETPSAATRALGEELRQSARTVVVARSGWGPEVRAAAGPGTPAPPGGTAAAPAPSGSPAPASPTTPRLPVQFTRFFGREEEIARLTELLRIPETRLVTLTGPGGSGKTRLAIAVAGRLQEEFQGGVYDPSGGARRSGGPWFVPLADVSSGERMGEALREALGLPPAPGVEPLEQAVAALRPQPALLVLDNCEQLAEPGALLIHALLSRLPTLTCLVTSRRRLGVAGEQEFIVLPLPTPGVPAFGRSGVQAFRRAGGQDEECDPFGGPLGPGSDDPSRQPPEPPASEHRNAPMMEDLDTLLAYPSVALFVDRAQAARPGFQLTAANAAAVAALCDRLEGLPLALELAAARAAILTPEQMLPRLTRRFELLVSHERTRSARHRSLRAAIDWSYQQLAPALQRFFAGLSVFRGGFDLEAAAAVCDASNVLDDLEQLRHCSLLAAEEAGSTMRFRLLESLREYGQEQLTAEQQSELSHRHAAFFMRVAEHAEAAWRADESQTWVERLDQEQENLRAALVWCQQTGESGPGRVGSGVEIGWRMAAALSWFWLHQGYLPEGREWLERALAGAERAPAALRARLLVGAGRLCLPEGQFPAARALLEESLTLFQEVADPAGIALALQCLGWVAHGEKDTARTRMLWEESLALWRPLGHRAQILHLLRDLTWLAADLGDAAAARSFSEERLVLMGEAGGASAAAARLIRAADRAREEGSAAVLRSIAADAPALEDAFGPRSEIADALDQVGECARDLQGYGLARAFFEQGLAINRALGRQLSLYLELYLLSQVTRLQGDLGTARACVEESLQIARAAGGKEPIAHALDELRLVALAQGDWQTARTLPRESLALWQELQNHWGLAEALEGTARLAISGSEAEVPLEAGVRAARLLGAAARLRERIGRGHHPHERAEYEQSLAATRAALGTAAFEAAWAQGQALTPEQAVAVALEP